MIPFDLSTFCFWSNSAALNFLQSFFKKLLNPLSFATWTVLNNEDENLQRDWWNAFFLLNLKGKHEGEQRPRLEPIIALS